MNSTKQHIIVAIADDHPVVLLGIRTLLAKNSFISIDQEFTNASSLIHAFNKANWDVLILDVDLKDGNGVELTKQILQFKPKLHILILSGYPESNFALRAMKAGAKGYVSKETMLETIEDAVLQVAQGKLYVSDELSQRLALEVIKDRNIEEIHSTLSDRELQVLCLYGAGKTNHEIADHLHISAKTVSTYRARLMAKMNLENTSELIAYAISHDLVP